MTAATKAEAAGRQDLGVLPFAGVRVLELCHTVMGPSCTMILADLGAEVIKVEPPEGERTRKNVGFGAGFFQAFNRNKRSIAINLKSSAGKKLLTDMIAVSDVIVENFAHGTMEKLGFSYENVAKINPKIIYCALKGYLSGPYEKRPALDEVVQYMGGLAYMTGPRGRPLRAGASVVDLMGGMFGLIGILAALRERERTGHGQLVTSALFESTAFMMSTHMATEVINGRPSPPLPEKSSSWAIYETFQTSDQRMVFIAITSDNHWNAFCTGFGHADLLSVPELKTNAQRALARARLAPLVAAVVAKMSLEEICAKLEKLKIPFGPLATPSDLFDDPHLNHGHMLDMQFTNGVQAKLPGLPLEMSNHQLGIRLPLPAISEHAEEIMAELGYSAAQIVNLIADQIVSVPQPVAQSVATRPTAK